MFYTSGYARGNSLSYAVTLAAKHIHSARRVINRDISDGDDVVLVDFFYGDPSSSAPALSCGWPLVSTIGFGTNP